MDSVSSEVFGEDDKGLFHEFEMFQNISKPKSNWTNIVTHKQGLFKSDDILGALSKFKYFKIQEIPEKVVKNKQSSGLYSFQILITGKFLLSHSTRWWWSKRKVK